MGKKTKRAKYTSKGGPRSVDRHTLKLMRADRSEADRLMDKLKLWARGKRVTVTVPNPNKNETNKRFIRVDGVTAFGPWKREDRRASND